MVGALEGELPRQSWCAVLSHITYTCVFKPGCLMSHNWLHTPAQTVMYKMKTSEMSVLQIHTPTSWKAQQLCAECLGLLGAVDPARVVVALDPPESLCRSTKDLLIILIMRHLVRLLRVASHIFVLDAAALAIQVWRSFSVVYLVVMGLLYKATPMVASINLQVLLRLRPYRMRGHWLLQRCGGASTAWAAALMLLVVLLATCVHLLFPNSKRDGNSDSDSNSNSNSDKADVVMYRAP